MDKVPAKFNPNAGGRMAASPRTPVRGIMSGQRSHMHNHEGSTTHDGHLRSKSEPIGPGVTHIANAVAFLNATHTEQKGLPSDRMKAIDNRLGHESKVPYPDGKSGY